MTLAGHILSRGPRGELTGVAPDPACAVLHYVPDTDQGTYGIMNCGHLAVSSSFDSPSQPHQHIVTPGIPPTLGMTWMPTISHATLPFLLSQNDLAASPGGDTRSDTYAASKEANCLSITPFLERDPGASASTGGTTLRLVRPVITISRDVSFDDELPIELGVEYGAGYWQ